MAAAKLKGNIPRRNCVNCSEGRHGAAGQLQRQRAEGFMVATNGLRNRVAKVAAVAGVVALSVVVLGCGTGMAAQGSFDRTYTVSGPIRLNLANGSGSVQI